MGSALGCLETSAYCIMPALLNMMSTPPQSSRCLTMASTSDSLETSHLIVSTRGESESMERTFERAFSRAGSEMSAMRTAAPSRAKRMVVSRPIPLRKGTSTAAVRRIEKTWWRCPCSTLFIAVEREYMEQVVRRC